MQEHKPIIFDGLIQAQMRNVVRDMLPPGVRSLRRNSILESINREVGYTYPCKTMVTVDHLQFEVFSWNATEYIHATQLLGEKELLRKMQKVVKGKHVWDIGAAFGIHTLNAALSGAASVSAFEPEPTIFAKLQKNIALYRDRTCMYASSLAISDQKHIETLYISDNEANAPSVHNIPQRYSRSMQIHSYAIPDLIAMGFPRPEVMKIDVESAEEKVLRGMGDVTPEHLFIELHPLYGTDMKAVGTLLNEKGYVFEWGQARGTELLCYLKKNG
jgi:FkbM family methyltransferase